MEGRAGLRILKPGDPALLRSLEGCIRVGAPCLLEDVGEELDPALEPVLRVRGLAGWRAVGVVGVPGMVAGACRARGAGGAAS